VVAVVEEAVAVVEVTEVRDQNEPIRRCGSENHGSFSAIVALNNSWELRVFEVTQQTSDHGRSIRRPVI